MSQELLTDDLGIGDTIDFGLDYIDLNQPDNDEAERSGSGSGINLEKISSTASQKKEFNEKLKERVPSNDAVGEHSPKIESVAVKQSNQPIQPGDGAEISGNSLQQQPQTQLQHQSDGQPPHSRSEIASQLQPQSNEQQVLQQQQQLHQDAPSNSIAKPSVFHSWKPLEPVRTDPVKALEARKRRLDRQPALKMPEIHYVGQVLDGKGIVSDSTEGSFCR